MKLVALTNGDVGHFAQAGPPAGKLAEDAAVVVAPFFSPYTPR